MAIYLVKSDSTRYFTPEAKYWQRDVNVELIEVVPGVEFSPTRAAFIASDDDLGDVVEFTLLYADDNAEILNLPRAGEKDGKHYYSCHWKLLKSVDIGGNLGPVPTPTPTSTPTPTPTPTNYVEEPIYDYIYDSMEAVSIIGGADGDSVVGYNDRSLTTIQGVNGVTGLSIANNIVTLTESGRYYLKARSDAFKGEQVLTSIKFISGDYADQNFDSPTRFASQSYSDMVVTETSVVVDITQTTKFKIQTSVSSAKTNGLNNGGATLFVQKLASVDGGGGGGGGGGSSSGGIGSLDIIKSKNSFYTELPDAIIANNTDQYGGTRILYLTHYGDGLNISYHSNDANNNWYVYFDKDDANGAVGGGGSNISTTSPFDTLRGYIENDRAIYYGGSSSSNGSSSSGGIGSLSAIRNAAGTFYTDLPDAIVVKGASDESRQHILTLQEVDDTRTDWQILYRAEDHGDNNADDKRIEFKADEHGSYHGRVWFTDGMTTNNLKWFIDNDRAIYYGGGSSSSSGSSSSGGSSSGSGSQMIFKTKYGPDVQRSSFAKDTNHIIKYTEIELDKYNSYNTADGNFTATHDMTISVNALAVLEYKSSNQTYRGILSINNSSPRYSYAQQSDIHDNNAYGGSLSASALISLKQGESINTEFIHYGVTTNINVSVAMTIVELSGSSSSGSSSSSGGSSDNATTTSNNVVSAIIADDGSLIDSSHDWIENSTKTATGNYEITFKSGYFTSIPAIIVAPNSSVTPVYKHASAEYNNVTISGCRVYLRAPIDGTQVDASFSILAHHQDKSNTTSSESGGIGDSPEIIASSNFNSKIPDAILLHPDESADEPRAYYFFGVDSSENVIMFRSNANKQISFTNNSSGDYNSTFTTASHVRYDGDTTLQDIIDNDHAIYYGGSSSSSGISSGGILSARISSDGTIVSQTPEWIESCTNTHDGTYNIIYKSDYFSSIPTIVATADLNNGVSQMNVEYDEPSLNGIWITTSKNDGSGSLAADFSIIAHDIDKGYTSSSLSDSSSGSNIVKGNYTGNGSDPQTIELGFRPAVVSIQCLSAPYYGRQTQIDGMDEPNVYQFKNASDTDVHMNPFDLIQIIDTGFKVTGSINNSGMNHNTSKYYYYALGATTGDSSSDTTSSFSDNDSPTTNIKMKEYIDSFNDLGFDPPDALIVKDHFNRMTVRYLHFVNSDVAGDGVANATWHFLYRTEFVDSGDDYYIAFKNEENGPVGAYDNTHSNFLNKNLKWYIDNGYAIYTGGSSVSTTNSSSNGSNYSLFGAKISIENKVGTVLSQTSDFIESITHLGGSSNNYDITFKDGTFTEAPIVTTSTFNTTGAYAETISINSPETTDYINGKKMTIKFENVSNTLTDFNSNTVGTYIADLIFMKSNSSSSNGASASKMDIPQRNIGISDYIQYSLTSPINSTAQSTAKNIVDNSNDYTYYSL